MPVISIDLGGTWIRAAVVTAPGTCGRTERKPTDRFRAREQIAADIIKVAEKSLKGIRRIQGIAVGVPTVLDDDGGLCQCDNLPTMTGFHVAQFLESRFAMPVRVFNDAACFAYGEWRCGVGRGATNLCGVTLGTGIGVGLVIDGKLHRGSHGCAGEIWKTPCDGGCIEDRVCGRAIERKYEQFAGEKVKAAQIAQLGKRGDGRAEESFNAFGRDLGTAICCLVNVIDPDIVVFGGSVSKSFALFRKALSETVNAGSVAGKRTRLAKSRLGDQAPLLGAAELYADAADGHG